MGRYLFSAVLAATVLGALGVVASHASIITITNTGTGTPGTVDPNYSVVISADPSNPGPTAFVTTVIPGSYFPNDATSKWISLVANVANSNFSAGLYDYRAVFSLAGLNPATAILTGSWASDNEATIFLNGSTTGDSLSSSAFGSLTPFSISSGFIAGTNTLDFRVTNDGPSGPSALRVEISGTASPSNSGVPEPASLCLLAAGTAAALLRKRRKTA